MPRGRSISSLSLNELQAMISSQRSQLSKLRRQRAEMQRDLDAIDRRIGVIEGRGGRIGGRAKNAKSLVKTMEEILGKSSKPMQVSAIVDAILAAGYKTTSANFRSIVNQTLIKEKQFTAAERGKYQLKK